VSAPGPGSGPGPVAVRIVDDLVRAGLLREPDRPAAVNVVSADLRGLPTAVGPADTSLRRRLAEIGGYAGAALVVAAVALLLARQWSALATGARVGILAAIAAVLAGGAVVLLARLPGPRAEVGHSAAGRLAGVLLGAAAVAAASAAGVGTGSGPAAGAAAGVAVGATLLVTGLLGYLAVPGTVGQLVTAVGAVLLVPFVLDLVGDVHGVTAGLLLLGIGVVWLGLAEQGRWVPLVSAQAIGCVIAFAGAQVPVVASGHPWVGYVATAALAAAAFTTYVVRQGGLAYLVLGVLATTAAVPEAVMDWTGGSLGAAGALLVAGLALLGASLAGLRLRREVTGP